MGLRDFIIDGIYQVGQKIYRGFGNVFGLLMGDKKLIFVEITGFTKLY